MPMNRFAARGFTLAELAIVLIIVALLGGGLLMSLGAQVDNRSNNDTIQQLQEAREALIGYAASHGAAVTSKPYLPCPDTDGNGTADWNGSTGNCVSDEGFLPWADLGLGRQDAWNNRFRYRLRGSAYFADNQNGFTLATNGNLRICEQAACSSLLATGMVAVIVSHGRNGAGATTSDGLALDPPTGADELANTDGNADFVYHPASASPNEFDDQLVWLSPNVLFARMIAAGKLP